MFWVWNSRRVGKISQELVLDFQRVYCLQKSIFFSEIHEKSITKRLDFSWNRINIVILTVSLKTLISEIKNRAARILILLTQIHVSAWVSSCTVLNRKLSNLYSIFHCPDSTLNFLKDVQNVLNLFSQSLSKSFSLDLTTLFLNQEHYRALAFQ